MPTLAITDIIVDHSIPIRRSTHDATVTRYMEAFDLLPPLTVVKTRDGLLLADGFHRIAAAMRLGHKEIAAIVRNGTREDALEVAVIANTKNGDPLTTEERDSGIRRLKAMGRSIAWISNEMSLSRQTVSSVIAAIRVSQEVIVDDDRGRPLTTKHFREIARAEERHWQPLADAAAKRGWSDELLALAVRNLKQPSVPRDVKQALLAGKKDPVVIGPDGSIGVSSHLAAQDVRARQRDDALLALERALEALRRLRQFNVSAIVGAADADRLDRIRREMPGDIRFMERVLEAASSSKLRVVS